MVAEENTQETRKNRVGGGRKEDRERGRERADSPLWPCNYIQSLNGALRGVGPHTGPCLLDRPRVGLVVVGWWGGRGSDLSPVRQL